MSASDPHDRRRLLPATGSPTSPISCSPSPRCAGPATPSSAGSPPGISRPVTLSFLRWSLAFLIILPFAWKHLVRDWDAIRGRLGIMVMLSDHRDRRLQHHAVLGARAHPGAEHAAAAVGSDRCSSRYGRCCCSAIRLTLAQAAGIALSLAGVLVDPAAGRPDHAEEYRVQPRRPHLHRRAGDLRALFGADLQASADPWPVVRRLYLRLRRRRADSPADLGTADPPGDAVRRRRTC